MPPRSFLERWLYLWLCTLCLFAFWWPRLLPAAADPFTASRPYLPHLIAAIMFLVGCLLPPDELRQLARQWPAVLFGTAVQYTVMPLLGWSVGQFAPSQDLFLGLVMVGCVPGAMASNVLTLLARGHVSYSVSLTTLATLLSPAIVPLALYLTLHASVALDPAEVSLTLLATVVAPVLAGFGLCRLLPPLVACTRRWGPDLANLVILWLIAVVVALNRDRLGQATPGLLVILLTVNALGYLAGYLGGTLYGLPETMRRALTIEVGMQNAGLGTTLALTLFPDRPAAAIPTALYTFGCMLTGALLARWWAGRAPVELERLPA